MNKKLIVLISSIIVSIVVLISSTYALLFKTDVTEQQSYKTGVLQITSTSVNNSVTLTNSLPTTDEDGAVSTPYTFKITNTGNLSYKFDVMLLSTTTDNQIDAQYIKVKVDNEAPLSLGSLTNGKLRTDITLEPGSSVTIALRVWLSDTTPNTQIGKTFNGKITTDGQAIYTVSNAPIDNSGANFPDLVEGLIPVVYNSSTSKWVKADTESSTSTYGWYDYTQKKWANAVLVSNNKSSIVNDLSSNNNNATIYGATYVTDGLSISDSSDTYVLLPSSNQVTLPATYSITFTLNSLDNQVFFGDYNTKAGLGIINNGANFVTGVGSTAQSNTAITGGLSINKEYTVDLVYHSITNVDVYLNGKLLSKSSSTDYWDWSDTNSYIGKRGNGQANFNGIIKRYIVYNDELTSSEINKNLSVTDSTICDSGIVCDNLKQYYNFKTDLRTNYVNSLPGTELTDSDILAFYVWIPRYKYKVWNINKIIGTDSYNAQTTGIDIVFENNTKSTGTINCTDYSFATPTSTAGLPSETCTGSSGNYYTHPAFTFGNTELRGFWMGKFELSSETPTASNGGGNSATLSARILPSVNSWRYNTVSNFNTVIQNMKTTDNIYGLSANITDSHMLTNMEWGAVAYLTNSNYGRCSGSACTEVTINNCSSYVTGIGGDTVSAGQASAACTTDANKYNGAKGVLASTTGNVYGVYDMSGGAYEYVMGNMSSTADTYTFYSNNSGFSSSWYNTSSNQKYVNTYANYSTGTNQASYNRARLGDATGEVVLVASSASGWYSDSAYFASSSSSWFLRGGYCSQTTNAGVFYFSRNTGGAVNSFSTRAALVWFTT